MVKTTMRFLNVKLAKNVLVKREVQYFSNLTLLRRKEAFVDLRELLDIVKTQFVGGSRLQEIIQKKLQIISLQILILKE